MKAVLNDEEFQRLERLFQHAEVRKRHDRVRRDDPQRANALFESRLDDVWIGQATRGRYPIDGDFPEIREFLAMIRVLELAVSGHGRGEAGLARAHGIALSCDGERPRADATNVAGDEREVVDRVDRLRSLRAVVDAHRPADEPRAGVAVERGRAEQQLHRNARDFRDPGGCGTREPTCTARRSRSCAGRCIRDR